MASRSVQVTSSGKRAVVAHAHDGAIAQLQPLQHLFDAAVKGGRRRRHGQRGARRESAARVRPLPARPTAGRQSAAGDGHEVLVKQRLAGDATVLGQQDADRQVDVTRLERGAHLRGIDRYVGHLALRRLAAQHARPAAAGTSSRPGRTTTDASARVRCAGSKASPLARAASRSRRCAATSGAMRCASRVGCRPEGERTNSASSKSAPQPCQRVAGGRLRQRQLAPGLGHRAAAVDRAQHAQQVQVELAEVHGRRSTSVS